MDLGIKSNPEDPIQDGDEGLDPPMFRKLKYGETLNKKDLVNLIEKRKTLKRGTEEFNDATEKIFASFYGMVKQCSLSALNVFRYKRYQFTMEECMTVAFEIIDKVIDRADFTRAPSPTTFAYSYLKFLTPHVLSQFGPRKYMRRFKYSLDKPVYPSDKSPTYLDRLTDKDGSRTGIKPDENGFGFSFIKSSEMLRKKVEAIIDDIPGSNGDKTITRDRKILKNYFLDEMTCTEIGEEFGFTRQHINKIIQNMLPALRRRLELDKEFPCG